MEWSALPEGNGLAYTAPALPSAHIQALGATLSQFLGTKGALAPEQINAGTAPQLRNAQTNPDDARAQLLLVASLVRQKSVGSEPDSTALQHARAWLASEAAQTAGVAGLVAALG
jgi:hypothetical protein